MEKNIVGESRDKRWLKKKGKETCLSLIVKVAIVQYHAIILQIKNTDSKY